MKLTPEQIRAALAATNKVLADKHARGGNVQHPTSKTPPVKSAQPNSARADPPPHQGQEQPAAPGLLPFDPPWYRPPDPATLPRRHYFYKGHYLRGTVGASIGAPGRLKSSTVMVEVISMACGRDLFTGKPLEHGPIRVAYLNGEENQDELDLRAAAIFQQFGVRSEDYADRLVILSIRDTPIRLAVMAGNRATAMLEVEALAKLRSFVERRNISVLILDPLVSFHSVSENSNEHMDFLFKEVLGRIAGESRCVEAVHHPRKLAPGESIATVDDMRGASAILGAVRLARTFNFMTAVQAPKLCIREDDRRLYVRIENGKANAGPLGKADWRKIEPVSLPNGEVVACSTHWQPKNPFDGVLVSDAKLVQTAAASGQYRTDSRSKEWLGWWMAENIPDLGITSRYDTKDKDKAEVSKLHNLLKTWVDNDVLRIETRPDKNRMMRDFYLASAAVPGALIEETRLGDTYNDD